MAEYEPVPSEEGETPSSLTPRSYRTKATAFIAVGCVLLFSAYVGPKFPVAQLAQRDDPLAAAPDLKLDNEHTRRTGRQLGDGLYRYKYLAQVHKPTRLQLDTGDATLWEIDGQMVSESPSTELEFTFTSIGKHTVSVHDGKYVFEVDVKAVRYEIRDLSDDDREAYFHALHTLYTLGQEEGEALYGSSYKSSDWLVRVHLEGAADLACDHWHDDAGIMNHHVGVTWQMEQSLRMIDPSTAAHYWDYTRDSADSSLAWYQSDIFNEDWFGSNSPSSANHVVNSGRWAFTEVKQDARAFSNITNPYGILRSPWNTNPVPYVMRSNRTFGAFSDHYTEFPTCSEFAEYVGSDLSEILFALNGQLHGPVHIMVGGQWDYLHDWSKVADMVEFADNYLLLGKVLWRTGYLRVPEVCSADTPHKDCMPSCPKTIIGGRSAYEILNESGAFDLTADTDWITAMDAAGLTYSDLLEELCHIGSPGEMFTSAAPQDPIFWPLHGNAERFVQYLRLLKDKGTISMDETWAYEHNTHVPSDTGLVCEWEGVTGMHMPTCQHKTCPGHKADDLLPFESLMTHQRGLYSNLGFYKLSHPDNDELPYVYDSLDYWSGCTNSSMLTEATTAMAPPSQLGGPSTMVGTPMG